MHKKAYEKLFMLWNQSCHRALWLCPAALLRAVGSSAPHKGTMAVAQAQEQGALHSLRHPPACLLQHSGLGEDTVSWKHRSQKEPSGEPSPHSQVRRMV